VGAAGAVVSAGCASAGAAANNISAMMAMRAMRDNGETVVIVARQHSSARHGGEARRASHSLPPKNRFGPLPPLGGGLGWGSLGGPTPVHRRIPPPPQPSPTRGGGSRPSVGRGSAPNSPH